MYGNEGIYFVTARTIQGRLLLRPSRQVREIIGGILGRAARRYGVGLRGFVFMSNHLHLLVRAPGNALSAFMQFLLTNVARKIGVLHRWRGPFWQRRFSCEPVLDRQAELGRLSYILAHGVKEGLVPHHAEWPGLSCLPALLGRTESFPFFNWDWRWQKKGLRGEDRWSSKLVEHEQIELEPITPWASLDSDERVSLAQSLCDELARQRQPQRRRVAGPEAVMRQHPHRTVALAPRDGRPLCHASSALVRSQWLGVYHEYRSAYRVASALFRGGQRGVEFPPWAFSPPPGVAKCAPNPGSS
jgi:REP element-mobilizing transposase RayT